MKPGKHPDEFSKQYNQTKGGGWWAVENKLHWILGVPFQRRAFPKTGRQGKLREEKSEGSTQSRIQKSITQFLNTFALHGKGKIPYSYYLIKRIRINHVFFLYL
ncbi:MAG: hypothetical protein LBH58_08555 [Tannerellaceae bacterium]|jgi:hypothetical protein|nr:hypothetical protein [Tannerellaceae bacterium]